MGRIQKRLECKTCGGLRLFQKEGPNHLLHLLLSIITGGLWIPVWFIILIFNLFTPFRCSQCGEPKLR